jgi:deoxyribodipyrimidine photolyase-related protein
MTHKTKNTSAMKLRIILTDQLSLEISSLAGCDKQSDLVLMCELQEELTYVKHHKKKIAFLLSAMRHFADELRAKGYKLEYVKIDDDSNTGYLKTEVSRLLKKYNINQIVVTHPGEFHTLENIKSWEKDFGIPVEIRQDDRFLCSLEDFASWANDRKQLRMEYFYRDMRQKHAILMNGNNPVGDKWNFDAENRNPPKEGMKIPQACIHIPDAITLEVMSLVATKFSDHFGDLEPFYFAFTREQALRVLEHFIEQRLANFGTYQDAMLENEPWMYHSHISFYLNCGLLLPLECIKAVERAYYNDKVDLNATEGFIRQVLGWREYVRGIYWLKMPKYKEYNFFKAKLNLPEFYWTANTNMNCMKQCISQTKELAYAHHIQRLMVLGNFALIAGINPDYVNEWFWIVYADAYEWVELPNVTGMILFADGGYLASKPYAAGGSYINKMSNYCKNCSYKVSQKSGVNACPFNYLYWYFLIANRDKLAKNQRLSMIYNTYDKMPEDKKACIVEDSKRFLQRLINNELV